MKRILLMFSLMAVCASAVTAAPTMQTYSQASTDSTIALDSDTVASIELWTNPSTGYSWQVSHDVAMVEMEESWYELGKEAKEGVVGAGGVEFFKFKALKTEFYQKAMKS